MRLVGTLTLEPAQMGPEDVEAARNAGASRDAIADAVHVCALFNIIDRCADALDFQSPEGFDRTQHAGRMLEMGYARIVGDHGDPPDRSGRPARMQAVADAILLPRGDLAPDLRLAAFIRAGILAGRTWPVPSSPAPQALPEPLAGFVDKVARHACRVTNHDIEVLKAAGHSEDSIFEAVVSTAVGAGLSRLASGMAAMGMPV